VDGIPDIFVPKTVRLGIVHIAVVILPRKSQPVISMPPGPKNKSGCPSDLHLRLPDDVREMVDSLGPGRYQENIIESIRKCASKIHPETLIEIQSRILDLERQRNSIVSQLKEAKESLQNSYGLGPEESEEIILRIESDARR
jgi:hypothetical protein